MALTFKPYEFFCKNLIGPLYKRGLMSQARFSKHKKTLHGLGAQVQRRQPQLCPLHTNKDLNSQANVEHGAPPKCSYYIPHLVLNGIFNAIIMLLTTIETIN